MLKTLIVEDHAGFRQLLRESLGNRFPSMILAEAISAKQALQKIKQFSPQLIFMDIKLLNGSSLPLVKKVKSIDPGIIIVVLSLYNIPEYRDAALRSGADHYLAKSSLTSSMLVELVESILPSPS